MNAARSDAVTQAGRPDTVYSLKLMGAVVRSLGVGVVRLNSDIISFANQRQKKLPLAPGGRYTGLVLLFSTETGEPLAIFPTACCSCMRVGATSAIAARYLAREDARTVAVLGAGAQAAGHVRAIAAMRKLDGIRCYSPTRGQARSVLPGDAGADRRRDARGLFPGGSGARRGHRVVRDQLGRGTSSCRSGSRRACTSAPYAVRSSIPAWCSRPTSSRSTTAAVPANAAATRGAAVPKDRHVIAGLDVSRAPTLAQLVAGTAQGRTSAQQKTCFVNLPGTGLQFAAAGAAFYRKARAAGRGRELPTEWFTEDVVP